MTQYTERPWAHLYGQGLPADITPDDPTMPDMLVALAASGPEATTGKILRGELRDPAP
jgi:long-chain acyl-CoA synthetase